MIRPTDDDDRLRAAVFAFLSQLMARDGVASWSTTSRQYQSAGGPLYSWIVLPPSTTSVCPVT